MNPSEAEIIQLYNNPASTVVRLARQSVITREDLLLLSSIERYVVADECWDKCNLDAKNKLLNDSCSHVKETAWLKTRLKPYQLRHCH